MTTEIAKPQMCLLTRTGVEIWLDKDKAEAFGNDWMSGMKAVVKLEGRFINTVDITGLFSPQDMEELTRRKNGEHQCKHGVWYPRGQGCTCQPEKEWDERGFYKL